MGRTYNKDTDTFRHIKNCVNLSKFKVDYSVHRPSIIDKLNILQEDIIRKEVRISWDGKQYSIRIPKEISEELNLTNEDKVVFTLTKPLPDSDDKPTLSMVIKNE